MPTTTRSLSIIGVLLLLSSIVYAQDTRTFSVVDFKKNLKERRLTILGLHQTEEGHILLGVEDKLYKFDGSVFHPFADDEHDNIHIIERIFSLKDGRYLILDGMSKQLFYLDEGQYSPYIKRVENLGFSGNTICQSDADSSIVTYRKNIAFSVEDTLKEIYKLSEGKNIFRTVYPFNKDSIFLATNNYALLLKIGVDTIRLPELKSATYLVRQKDRSLVFTSNGLYELDHTGTTKYLIDLPKDIMNVSHAVTDASGNVWFSGRNRGLYRYNNQKIENISESLGIKGKQITYLMKDKDQNIWIATLSSGLICVLNTSTKNYTHLDGLSSDNITSITKWKDIVLIGTNNGLNGIHNEQVMSFNELIQYLDLDSNEISKATGYIHAFHAYEDQLMISSNLIRGRRRMKRQESNIFSEYFNTVEQIEDSIWIGVWGRVLVRQKSDLGKRIEKSLLLKDNLRLNFLKSYQKQTLLLGTNRGLYVTDHQLSSFRRLEYPSFDKDIQFYDALQTIEGRWFFASSEGLYEYYNEKWKHHKVANDKKGNLITSLSLDSTGRLWVGSYNGLCLYSKNEFQFFSTGDGLVSNIIRELLFDRETGIMWVTSSSGLSSFRPSKLIASQRAPDPLNIYRFEVIGDRDYLANTSPTLEHSNNSIRIHFSSLNHRNPSQVRYQYRLNPVQKEWHSTVNNYAEFMALEPNDYEFLVRSQSVGTGWGDVDSTSFTIHPPFWKTIWFIATLVVLLLLATVLLFRWRFKNVLRREEEKSNYVKRISYLQQQTLARSMNPHFISNALNSIQSFFSHIKNEEAMEYIAELGELMRLNIDSEGNGVILINEEVKRLSLYFSLEKSRVEFPFEYSIELDTDLKNNNPLIPRMLIQPLVENAIKHGISKNDNGGWINVKIHKGEPFIVEVTDNGPGLTRKKNYSEHKSYALNLIRERLKLIPGENQLLVENWEDADGIIMGCKVELKIYL